MIGRAIIDAVIDETSEELRKVRRESGRLYQSMETRIAAELTPDQRREYEEMQKLWRERRKFGQGGLDGKNGKPPGTPGPPPESRGP